MYTEPDSIGDSYVRNISGTKQQKKMILNVHIENWIIMELPSKMNSELESNNPPPPTFANTLFPILCLSRFFEGVSHPFSWTMLLTWFTHFYTQFLASAVIYRKIH